MNPKEVILKWVDGFNAHDPVMISELYHESAQCVQIAIGEPLLGKNAIRKDLENFFRLTPDSYTKVENILEQNGWVALEWTGGGTYYKDVTKLGKTYTLRGSGFFLIEQGKIVLQRGYWDKATWFNQVE